MSQSILIYLQNDDGRLRKVGFELIGKAYELSNSIDLDINVVVIGKNLDNIENQLVGQPIKKLFKYETNMIYNIDIYSQILTSLCKKIKPEIILIGATKEGRGIAPQLSILLNTGLTADCTDLQLDDSGKLIQIRPAFEESILAYINTITYPQIATVREGIMNPVNNKVFNSNYEVIHTKVYENDYKSKSNVLEVIVDRETNKLDITKEDILVAIGGGVKKPEHVDIFMNLATSINGELACSRKLVERGWFNIDRQIGMSGNIVKSRVLITIGISGSVQFLAGVRNVEKIIAINKDKDAPIFNVADYSIVTDLEEIINYLKGDKISGKIECFT